MIGGYSRGRKILCLYTSGTGSRHETSLKPQLLYRIKEETRKEHERWAVSPVSPFMRCLLAPNFGHSCRVTGLIQIHQNSKKETEKPGQGPELSRSLSASDSKQDLELLLLRSLPSIAWLFLLAILIIYIFVCAVELPTSLRIDVVTYFFLSILIFS